MISRAPIFLPRYSGVRPTIRPATNTVITARTRMPYRPEPVPPGATSPSIMFTIGMPPPSAVYESWNESTEPVDVSVVDAAKVAELSTPNRCSVPSVAAPTAVGTVPECSPLQHVDHDDAADGHDGHRRQDRVALLVAADHPAERAGQAERDDQQQEDLEPVGPVGRVLERVGAVGVVEAAAVGAQVLDGLLAGHRAAGDVLRRAGQRVHVGAAGRGSGSRHRR